MTDTPVDERPRSRDGLGVVAAIAAVAAVAALAVAIVAIVMAGSSDSDGTVAAGGAAGGGGGGGTAEAALSEFSIDLSSNVVPTGTKIAVINNGTTTHNLAVRDTDLISSNLEAGETGELDVSTLAAGTYEVYCQIPGHDVAGMKAQLTIGAAGTEVAATDSVSADHTEHTMTAEEGAAQDQAMIDSIMAFPAETKGKGNQPLAPTILPDGTKHFDLTAAITDWEVRPGEVVQAWAYNGTVPGPRIDVEVGDKVEVQITNNLPIGTDIHWHGIDVPNDQDGVAPITQDMIKSGESYTYRFTTTEPAIGMYHAHAHAHESVPNGLLGTFYVGHLPMPAGRTVSGITLPADLTVSQDLPMVLNDAGVIGLSLDGKSFPATAPVVAKVGDWIRVTYFNEGLQVHPMHLHGFEQFVIAKDGEPLDQPYAADTILIGPGERYTVLFQASAPGTWVWHCHILNHVESNDGMFGMVTAVVVS